MKRRSRFSIPEGPGALRPARNKSHAYVWAIAPCSLGPVLLWAPCSASVTLIESVLPARSGCLAQGGKRLDLFRGGRCSHFYSPDPGNMRFPEESSQLSAHYTIYGANQARFVAHFPPGPVRNSPLFSIVVAHPRISTLRNTHGCASAHAHLPHTGRLRRSVTIHTARRAAVLLPSFPCRSIPMLKIRPPISSSRTGISSPISIALWRSPRSKSPAYRTARSHHQSAVASP